VKEHQAGQIVFGRYDLQQPLAKGGMSSLWIARDRKLGRQVALKLMTPDYASQERHRQRFELEAKAVARIQNPNVVQIYDYGVDNQSPFIVMELLRGEDLRIRLKRIRRLPLPALSDLIRQVAHGLMECHEAGLVHRDLKPGNLFLAETRTGEVLKILDFGVAKEADVSPVEASELTEAGAVVGTPQYMSPEQARSLPNIDKRSDLFSLGVIIYRALTGKLPFKGKSPADLRVNICTKDFVPPSERAPWLPLQVDDFMRRALAKSPEQRFQDAQEMADALTALVPLADANSDLLFDAATDDQGPSSLTDPSGSWLTAGSGTATTAPSASASQISIIGGEATATNELSLSGSHLTGASLERTLLESATKAQQQSRRYRQIAAAAVILLILGAAGVAGSLMGDRAAGPDGMPATSSPATPPEPNEPDEAPTEDEEDDREAPEPVPISAPEPTSSSEAKPAPPRVPRPRPVKPKPQPPAGDDWDPLKTRK